MTDMGPEEQAISGPPAGQIWPGGGPTEVAVSTNAPFRGQLSLWVDEDAFPPSEPGGGDAVGSRMVPVFVFHGEANAGGFADNNQATVAEQDPRPGLQILNSVQLNWFEPLDIGANNNLDHTGLNPSTHGWEVGLANSIENGEWWNTKAYLVQTGQGGSLVNQWNVGGIYWTKFLQRVRAAKILIEAAGEIPVIYVWQSLGINDAIAGTNENTWLTGMKDLARRIRGELGYVPIISPRIMAGSPGAAYNDSLDLWDSEDPMFFLVSESGATTRDANHWDYAGMKLLASRMVAACKAFGQHEGYILRQTGILAAGQTVAAPTQPSIVRNPSSVSFTEGGNATFTVALSMAPASNIGVNLSASGGNVTVSPTSMIFTSSNWNVPQTATVTSPDDAAANGNRSSTVTCSGSATAGPVAVTVTVVDAGPSYEPANTTPPAITGIADVGSILTCSRGSWTNTPTLFAHQWKRNGANISGATGSTYVVASADVGTTLLCTVTATNGSGSTAADSNSVGIMAAMDQMVWTDHTAGATVDANGYLTSGTSGSGANATVAPFASAAALPASAFVVVVDWFSETDANGTVFALDDAASTDFDWLNFTGASSIYVNNGLVQVATSSSSAVVVPGWALSYPCKVRIEGDGSDVVYSSSTDGVNWAWRYTHAGRLVGLSTVYPRVYFVAPTANQKINAAVPAAAPPTQQPINTVPPIIDGIPSPSQILTCSNGSWTNSPTSFAWQWKRNGTNVSGAVLSTYVVQAGDVGSMITCDVTATNAVGPSSPVTSNGVYVPDVATLVPVDWDALWHATAVQGEGRITGKKSGSGGVAVPPLWIDLAASFDIVVTFFAPGSNGDATVCFVDGDNNPEYDWDSSQEFIFGIYHYKDIYYAPVDATTLIPVSGHPTPVYPHRIMMSKFGDDVVYRWGIGAAGPFGGIFHSKTGILVDKPVGCIKMLTFDGGGTLAVHYAAPTEFQMRPERY